MTALGSVVNDMHVASDQLNRRGYSARLVTVSYCGEAESRLVVRREGSRVCVEVMAPPQDASDDRWYAVRISSGRRTVWCGPSRSDVVSGLDLLPFLTDLLALTERLLSARYRRCEPRT